ncbi:MAG TPA: hypothetical protein VE863_04330 [Pyrinomonadaceae bacterium]|nr:hypothetical protein [Pyrinomonadaceae bacterium]
MELALVDRVADVFTQRVERSHETLSSGVAEVDLCWQGFPRGAITEIHGAASAGRISLLLSALAFATTHDESCALIDCNDTFDVFSAAAAGIDFNKLLWVRCSSKLEAAFKSADLLLHGGGFGVIALNLADAPAGTVRRIVSSWWFRFRRAVENTPTALIVLTPRAVVRSSAALVLELKNEETVWPSTLSCISRNSYGTFTINNEAGGQLSLIRPPASKPSPQTHSHYLHSIKIRIDCQRPVSHGPCAKFQPHVACEIR